MARLDDRHAARQRFNGVQTKGLAIQRRRGENSERTQKRLLLRAIQIGMKFDIRGETKPGQSLPNLLHEWFIGWTQAPADAQLQILHAIALPNERVTFGQQIQSFLAAHPREIAQHRRIRRSRCRLKAIQIDSVRHNAQTVGAQIKPPFH